MNPYNIESSPLRDKHYLELRRGFIFRLASLYLLPLILLIAFFIYQYSALINESRSVHLMSVAESQSRILDIYLKERVSNLLSLIDSPEMDFPPDTQKMGSYLSKLKRDSDAFIDLGFFDTTGVQTLYAGPLSYLAKKNYSREKWYMELRESKKRFVITDIYLGLRNEPHFTIGAKRSVAGKNFFLKASLDPARIYEYMTSLEKSPDVYISIINEAGKYQLVHHDIGIPLKIAHLIPKDTSSIGVASGETGDENVHYAFARLAGTNWIVLVHSRDEKSGFLNSNTGNIVFASLIVIAILIIIIIFRSKKMVLLEYEKDIVKSQLEHAARLATVGELAAGIAHEIGNPLNIIANEVGIMQDFANPKFNIKKDITDLHPHFDKIMKAVFRCKDINKKLMTFVRKDDFKIQPHDIHTVIDEFINGFFEHEMSLRNIKIVREYSKDLPKIMIDDNQFRQVLVNLLNNAADAIKPPGTITLTTLAKSGQLFVSVSDTGCGISQEQIAKIFMPFFTTKPVGKGTGLGLSVSFGIIKNMGGTIKVESIPGKGSSFTIVLPLNGTRL